MAHHGGHNKRKSFPERRKKRIAEADQRNAAWRALSFEEQIASLDARDLAARKQRARITEAIAKREADAMKARKKQKGK